MAARDSTATAWFYRDCWGFSTIPAGGDASERITEMTSYAQALCNAIAADGVASEAEIAWVQGYLACKGFGSLAHQVVEMAKAAEAKSVEQIVEDTKASMNIGSLKFAGKAIVYDSLRASMADGLDAKEDKAIAAIAGAFGVDAAGYAEIKELALAEEAHRAKKAKIILPGHPNLAAKYK
jgi:hypothetical protein